MLIIRGGDRYSGTLFSGVFCSDATVFSPKFGRTTSLVLETVLGSSLDYPDPHAYIKVMGEEKNFGDLLRTHSRPESTSKNCFVPRKFRNIYKLQLEAYLNLAWCLGDAIDAYVDWSSYGPGGLDRGGGRAGELSCRHQAFCFGYGA